MKRKEDHIVDFVNNLIELKDLIILSKNLKKK